MTTLKLDNTHDLALEDNSLVLLSDLVAETAQRLKTKFQFFYGEWQLEPRAGMPLFEKVLVKNPNLAEIRDLYRETITQDTAVEELNSLELDFDSPTRNLSISFEATLTDGSFLIFEDFILGENR